MKSLLFFSQVKDRHLNPKAACLKKREEEKAAMRLGSCSTPLPLTPTGGGGGDASEFDFEGLTGEELSLSLPSTSSQQQQQSNGGLPSSSTTNSTRSLSPTTVYYSAGNSPFQSNSPASSFQYSLPYNPSPPPLTPTEKIPRVKSDPHMKRKANGNVSPTLRKAKAGGVRLLPNGNASASTNTRNDPRQE